MKKITVTNIQIDDIKAIEFATDNKYLHVPNQVREEIVEAIKGYIEYDYKIEELEE